MSGWPDTDEAGKDASDAASKAEKSAEEAKDKAEAEARKAEDKAEAAAKKAEDEAKDVAKKAQDEAKKAQKEAEEIKDKAEAEVKKAEDEAKAAEKKAEQAIGDAKKKAEQAAEEAKQKAEEVEKKAGQAVADAEKKAEEAEQKAKQALADAEKKAQQLEDEAKQLANEAEDMAKKKADELAKKADELAKQGNKLLNDAMAKEQAMMKAMQAAEAHAEQELKDLADGANALMSKAEGMLSKGEKIADALFDEGAMALAGAGARAGQLMDEVKNLDDCIPQDVADCAKNALEDPAMRVLDTTCEVLPCGRVVIKADPKMVEAKQIIDKASKAEAHVTPLLQNLAKEGGMTMEGLDYRLKTVDSLARKLKDTPGDQINDALRYTMISDPADMAKNIDKTFDALKKEGHQILGIKNTFKDGAPYKGVNVKMKSPDGQPYELQFHTPQSFDVKQHKTHELYEKARVLAADDPAKEDIAKELVQIASAIPNPPNLKDAVGKHMP